MGRRRNAAALGVERTREPADKGRESGRPVSVSARRAVSRTQRPRRNACAPAASRFLVRPPRSPKLHAAVERVTRTHAEEF